MAASSSRRRFLGSALASAGALAALSRLAERTVSAAAAVRGKPQLSPVCDEATGLPLLKLPPEFRYRSFGWTGDVLADGRSTPGEHDGMAVIRQQGDLLTLCRNHEIKGSAAIGAESLTYDASAGGGCTNLEFNLRTGQLERSWCSLSGTVKNCAGGVTPWGTWLSCEETVDGPGDVDDSEPVPYVKEHGWIFEVPTDGKTAANPLKAMGRFVHEAVAIDPRDGLVYETEDQATAGFYRFIPNAPENLAAGGQLQMLCAAGRGDLRSGCRGAGPFDVTWVDIDDPQRTHSPGTSDSLGVYSQGKAQGGTTFNRIEGCWFGEGLVYFSCTEGGDAGLGQIWAFSPGDQKLTLVFESPSKEVLANPDNLTVGPGGGLVLCEDSDNLPLRMHALSREGQLAAFAENNLMLNGERNLIKGDFRDGEWSGVCFSPDGRWLFANIQKPGVTFAITGPWENYGI